MTSNGIYSNMAEMTPATILLKIAYDTAVQMGINISGQFLLGAIAPDGVFARIDCSLEDINNSHYRQESIKQSWLRAADEFKTTNNLFLKGYCIHIMADVLWLSGIYAELKKLHGDNFEKNILVDDMNFLEKWLYKQKEYLSLWNGVSGAKITNINYYVSPGEVELFKSQKSQSIKYDIVADGMKYLTLDEVDVFTKKAVKKIVAQLKR